MFLRNIVLKIYKGSAAYINNNDNNWIIEYWTSSHVSFFLTFKVASDYQTYTTECRIILEACCKSCLENWELQRGYK